MDKVGRTLLVAFALIAPIRSAQAQVIRDVDARGSVRVSKRLPINKGRAPYTVSGTVLVDYRRSTTKVWFEVNWDTIQVSKADSFAVKMSVQDSRGDWYPLTEAVIRGGDRWPGHPAREWGNRILHFKRKLRRVSIRVTPEGLVGAGTDTASIRHSRDAFDAANDAQPDGVCRDGEVDQPDEQCDGSNVGCAEGNYCTSACSCQPVAPFADGTWIRTPKGNVYRSVGNAPIWLSTCEPSGSYPGCPASFWNAPQEFVDALITRHPAPADGSLVRRPDGAVFQMRSGRAEYVRSCAEVGTCNGLVDLDWPAIDRLGGQAPWDKSKGHGLTSGGQLLPGEYLDSPDGTLTFVHQTDGNVVLYRDGGALWSTGTPGQATAKLAMQPDGNLVLYAPNGTPLWHTSTHGHAGATLSLQNDCNVVVYNTGGQPVWNAGTWRACGTCQIECCNPHGHFVTLNGVSRPLCGGVSACSGQWGGVRNRFLVPNYSAPAEWLFHNPNC